jgi:hypothetical protein
VSAHRPFQLSIFLLLSAAHTLPIPLLELLPFEFSFFYVLLFEFSFF